MSIVTTFDNQCRALTSTTSPNEDASRFLVGTLSPNGSNLLYLFEYKDDNNNLAKVSFNFPFGEVWHLSTSQRYPNLVAGILGNRNKFSVELFKLPNQFIDTSIEDDYGLSETPIEQVAQFGQSDGRNLARQSRWHPDDGYQLLTCSDGVLDFWDIEQQKKARTFSLASAFEKFSKCGNIKNSSANETKDETKLPIVTDLRWSSLFDCSVVAAAAGSEIYGIDTRIPESSPASICWLIEDRRCVRVRSIDFNPNSQYYVASGGDDCRANFWDLRQTSRPVLHFQTHTHWIWGIRYNPFHDQLVLSAGSDAQVVLMRAQSVSSDPHGQVGDYDNDDEDNDDSECDNGSGDVGSDVDRVVEDKENVGAPRRDHMDGDDDQLISGRYTDSCNRDLNETEQGDKKEKRGTCDEVINVYREHDDAVYAIEWATDPWIFASLGLESRLVISRVPKEEKFNILF